MTRRTAATRALLATLLTTAVLVQSPAVSADLPSDADFSYDNPRYANAATLAVEGTLETIADTKRGSDQYAYAVRTDEGDAIGLPASFGDDAPTGGRFEGELVIAGAVAADMRAKGLPVAPGKVIDAGTSAGEIALAVIAEQQVLLPVASATVTEPVAEAATPSAHHAYVAVITNRGTLPSDSEIATKVAEITAYWDDEAGAAITSFDIPTTVKYASSAANATTCGLGNNNWNQVWTEARGKFPVGTFNPSTSPNPYPPGAHLIVLIPESCNPEGSVGIGTVGTAIADGGSSIVEVGGSARQIGSHELGHNFGLGHANLEYCSTTSCQVDLYANMYSVMGFATGSFAPPALDTASRRLLDLTDEVQDVELVASGPSTTLNLVPRSAGAGLRGLRVVDPETGDEYFVDYRSGTEGDEASFYATTDAGLGAFRYAPGIVITQDLPDTTYGDQTKVLTRRSGASHLSSLEPGATFTSRNGAVQITAGTQGGASGADVTVTLVATPVPSAVPTMTFAGDSVPRSGSTVTAVPGVWDPGATLTYQWLINGGPITGATGPTYVVPYFYYAGNLSVSVTGSKPGFVNQERSSAAALVAAGNLAGARPTITGTRKVRKTLRVAPGAWTPGTTLTYRWYANGKAISKATKSSYKITKAKKKKRITVKVTGSQYGYTTTFRISARTSKIK